MRGTMQLLGGKPQGQQPGKAPDRQPRQHRSAPQQQNQQASPPDHDSFDDDIPFADASPRRGLAMTGGQRNYPVAYYLGRTSRDH